MGAGGFEQCTHLLWPAGVLLLLVLLVVLVLLIFWLFLVVLVLLVLRFLLVVLALLVLFVLWLVLLILGLLVLQYSSTAVQRFGTTLAGMLKVGMTSQERSAAQVGGCLALG